MVTDNFPVDFIYISRRLVERLALQHEAGRPRWLVETMETPDSMPVAVTAKQRPVNYANWFDLARRATEAVSDHTGWLDRADSRGRVPTGRYVRLRVHLQTQKVPLGTWEDAHNHPIAAFVGYEGLPGLGSIFVGLVGSASNYQHHLPGGQPSTANRTPSDARGLYDIIQQTRELDSDPEISRHWRDRADDFASDEERFDDAANLFNACKLYAPSRLLEALIEVHHRGVQRLHRGSCGLCG